MSLTTCLFPLSAGHRLIIGQNLANLDIVVRQFSPEDTALYLSKQLGASPDKAKLLGTLLGNYPAKLTAAVTYIKGSKITLEEYISYYQGDLKDLLAKQKKMLQSTHMTVHHQESVQHLNLSLLILAQAQALPAQELAIRLKEQEIQIFLSYSWNPTKVPADMIDSTFQDLGPTASQG